MKGKIVKCIVSKYDESILEPPFKTIKIGEVEVFEPENNDLGVTFARNLKRAAILFGDVQYHTTTQEKGYDYEIVINSPEYQAKVEFHSIKKSLK